MFTCYTYLTCENAKAVFAQVAFQGFLRRKTPILKQETAILRKKP